ncbi:ATP-binding cassette domain-containing protein [Siminovitchia sp. FSL H7-0308]|uniref:ABC-type lipoprotein export system ATPase subunit n=1 Tax=Siminovitchia thermophila TaxID=1245522 RepID=A0ABS2R4P1_9BACI|nr:ATP-binding cassette domain-containing protein [Siminovitchia thermophila]MBM7714578.1 ABC-type lipoprotein export system ATPase subunit [Siminovitchia thermophila]ONK22631.1 hypothetical protein BLX87_14720 [Bacillus sp. VT-16-64]
MSILDAQKSDKSDRNQLNKQEVLKGIDIQVENGDVVSIMSASGSGKMTLLNVLSSIDKVSRDTIKIDGKDIVGRKEKQRVIFIKDGQIHTQLKGEEARQMFLKDIMKTQGVLGGVHDEH